MVSVEEDREVEVLRQASHQGRELTRSDKLTLSLGRANQHRDVQLTRGREDRLNRTRSATLKWPIATPAAWACARTFRNACMTYSSPECSLCNELLLRRTGKLCSCHAEEPQTEVLPATKDDQFQVLRVGRSAAGTAIGGGGLRPPPTSGEAGRISTRRFPALLDRAWRKSRHAS